MAEVKWIKIVTDIFDDEKILLIESMPEADAIIVIWFKMLCLAGKQNNSGVFQLHGRIAYTDEMFATIFRRPVNTVRLALKTFEQFGMIEIVNDTVTIPNWGKHQSIEQIEARREYQRQYHQAYRKQQKLLIEDGEEPRKRLRKQDVNTPDKIREDKNREDKNREEEIDKEDDEERVGACGEINPFGGDRIEGDGSALSTSLRSATSPSADGEARGRGETTSSEAEARSEAMGTSSDLAALGHLPQRGRLCGNVDTAQKYALDNLRVMTPGNMQEFNEFLTVHGLPEDVVKYAIDVACGNGAAVWNYVAQVLYGWLDAGVKSVGDAKAEQEKRRKKRGRDAPPGNPFGLDRRNNRVPEKIGDGIVV